MHDHIGEIHQHPLPATQAFDRERAYPALAQILFYSLRDTLDLAVRTPGADEEVISNRRNVADFQQDEIVRLLLECKTA